MSVLQCFRSNLGIGLEGFGQLVQIDFVIFHLVARGKSLAAHEWQAAVERQVAALAIQVTTFAGACALALGTTTGSLTLPSGNPTANAFLVLFGALIGHKIV
jgi:hypothetical protein